MCSGSRQKDRSAREARARCWPREPDGTLLLAAWKSWHPALGCGTLTPAAGPHEPWGHRSQCQIVVVLGTRRWVLIRPELPFHLARVGTWSGRGHRAATAGSVQKAAGKQEGVFWFFNSATLAGWMRGSWASWNCRVDFPVVFHRWRSHRHTGLLRHCLPPAIWSRWPACHSAGPLPLPTAMCLQQELGCSPLVGIQGDLFVRIWRGAQRTIEDKCAVSCF